MPESLYIFIFMFGIGLLFLAIYVPLLLIKKKYTKFVEEHSIALKQVKEINDKFSFKTVNNFDMKHNYDNENMFKDITCKDYLTYQLVYIQKQVKEAIKDASYNKGLFEEYSAEIKENVVFGTYDIDNLPKNSKRLNKYEKKIVGKSLKSPTIELNIAVCLILTNIKGTHKFSKNEVFGTKVIENIMAGLANKRGNFYLNNEIWQSICRVERGKVTNKMRFAIYKRDNYRCRKCGRKTNDLEVDHIYPIAKGGKSTYDNLQTLCHRCNVKKGANVE